MKKTFNLQYNIGAAKYVVNFHDGIKTHADGSPFFDIHIFSNKMHANKFVRTLLNSGYVPNGPARF